MTLILSLLTKDTAIQVGDRRVVWSNGRTASDRRNKLTLFDRRLCFGYTGLAMMGKQKTDIWLSDVLRRSNSRSISEALDAVSEAATKSLARYRRSRKWTRLAIVGVGWSDADGNGRRYPIICRVSNFHNENGSPLSKARDSFSSSVSRFKGNERSILIAIGADVSADLTQRLQWQLRHHMKKRCNQRVLVELLARHVQRCAAENGKIGPDVLSVNIPRDSVTESDDHVPVFSGAALDESVTFLSWNGGKATEYGPNLVAPGGIMVTGIRSEPLSVHAPFPFGESLGGWVDENKPVGHGRRRIQYPCCYFINEKTRSVRATTLSSGEVFASVYTDDSIADQHAKLYGNEFSRRMIRTDRDFSEFLRSLSLNGVGIIAYVTVPDGHTKFSIRRHALLADVERLGGLERHEGRPFIKYPCCYFTRAQAERPLIGEIDGGKRCVAVYTNDRLAKSTHSIGDHAVERRMVWNDELLRNLLQSVPPCVKWLAANPGTSRIDERIVLSIKEVLAELPEAVDPSQLRFGFSAVSGKRQDRL